MRIHVTKLNEKGFTLLEVMLFLAISGALVVIALTGMSTSIRNVRFSTGMRDISDNIVSEFSAAKLGENNQEGLRCQLASNGRILLETPTATLARGAQADCVVAGKVLGVRNDKIEYYTIIARRNPHPNDTANCEWPQGFLQCYLPTVRYSGNPTSVGSILEMHRDIIAVSDHSYEYKNGIAELSGGNVIDLVYGYIQDPKSTATYRFFYRSSVADLTFVTVSPTDPQPGRNGRVCFGLSGRKASLTFDVAKEEPELKIGDPAC